MVGESKTCPGERDSSESRCPLWIWSFQRANTSEAKRWPWIHCHLKTKTLTNRNRPAKRKQVKPHLSAGFVKQRDVQCFVRTAGVHHLHRCCGFFLWQQQLCVTYWHLDCELSWCDFWCRSWTPPLFKMLTVALQSSQLWRNCH